MGRAVASGFGDGWRISGPIVGSKEFTAKVLSDISKRDEAERQNVSVSKAEVLKAPTLPELIGEAVNGINEIEPICDLVASRISKDAQKKSKDRSDTS